MFYLETEKVNESIVVETGLLNIDGVEKIGGVGFMNSSDLLQLAISITPAVITALTTVILNLLHSNKEFTLKADGKELSFKGYSKKEIGEILAQYAGISVV